MSDLPDSLPLRYWYSRERLWWKVVLSGLFAAILAIPVVYGAVVGLYGVDWWLTLLVLVLVVVVCVGLWEARHLVVRQPALMLGEEGCTFWEVGLPELHLGWDEVLPAVSVEMPANDHLSSHFSPLVSIMLSSATGGLLQSSMTTDVNVQYPVKGTGNRFRGEDLGSHHLSARALGTDPKKFVGTFNSLRAHALQDRACRLPEPPKEADEATWKKIERMRWFVEHTLPNDPWNAKEFEEHVGPRTTVELGNRENFKVHTYGEIGGQVTVRPGKLVVSAELEALGRLVQES